MQIHFETACSFGRWLGFALGEDRIRRAGGGLAGALVPVGAAGVPSAATHLPAPSVGVRKPSNRNDSANTGLISRMLELAFEYPRPRYPSARHRGREAHDAAQTVQSLLAVLDKSELVHALDRVKQRRVMRLVE
jgi:hypothetical protein